MNDNIPTQQIFPKQSPLTKHLNLMPARSFMRPLANCSSIEIYLVIIIPLANFSHMK